MNLSPIHSTKITVTPGTESNTPNDHITGGLGIHRPYTITGNADSPAAEQAQADFQELVESQRQLHHQQGTSDEQLSALQSSVESLDDSEIPGFLAMLQSQASWNSDTSGQAPSPAEEAPAIRSALQSALSAYAPLPRQQTPAKQGAEGFGGTQSDFRTGTESQPTEELLKTASFSADKTGADLMAGKPDTRKAEGVLLSATRPEAQPVPVRVPNEVVRSEAINDIRQPTVSTTLVRQDVSASHSQGAERSWSDAMGQRLVSMLSEGRQEARIRLDPPELGTMGVRLVMQASGVSVQFHSDLPQVRELLENQAGRLRDAMDQQGFNLVDVNVGSDRQSQQQHAHTEQQKSGYGQPLQATAEPATVTTEPLPTGLSDSSLINTFA